MIGYKIVVGDKSEIIIKLTSALKHFRFKQKQCPHKPVSIKAVVILDNTEYQQTLDTTTAWVVKGIHVKGYPYECSVPTREKARNLKRIHTQRGFTDVKIVRRTYEIVLEEPVR